MTSEDATNIAKLAMERALATLDKEDVSANEKELAETLQESAQTLLQAIAYITSLQQENDYNLKLLKLSQLIINSLDTSGEVTKALMEVANQLEAGVQDHQCDGDCCNDDEENSCDCCESHS